MAQTAIDKIFRSDINGLRAWAVVAVVLYHFGVPGLQGGFVGVDVFFVISGFLMTRLIIVGLESAGGGVIDFIYWDFMQHGRAVLCRRWPCCVPACCCWVGFGCQRWITANWGSTLPQHWRLCRT